MIKKVRKKKYQILYVILAAAFLLLCTAAIHITLVRYFSIKAVENFALIRFNIDYKNLEECQIQRTAYYTEEFLKLVEASGNTEKINDDLLENQYISALVSKKILYQGKENGYYQIILYATVEGWSEADPSYKENMAISWLISLRRCSITSYKIAAIQEYEEDIHND